MDIRSNKVYEHVTFDKDCAVDEILTGAKFIRCSFQGMDLEDITTNKCTFSECNLKAIRLNGSRHINSAFTIVSSIMQICSVHTLKIAKCLVQAFPKRISWAYQ